MLTILPHHIFPNWVQTLDPLTHLISPQHCSLYKREVEWELRAVIRIGEALRKNMNRHDAGPLSLQLQCMDCLLNWTTKSFFTRKNAEELEEKTFYGQNEDEW